MSNISKRRRDGFRTKIKSMGDHKEFLKRITKTLYYGQLPTLPCLSLPVTEISCEVWSMSQRGRSLRRLHADAAAQVARAACVSPCALVLAILYLERLHACNPHYLADASPHDLFLVTLMVSNKFLQDDGEDDEVICSEWATSGGIDLKQLNKLEVEFLNAIEWNVFVSDKSFEAGLSWLERQVALRQAQARGFYTYGDLAAAAAGDAAADLLRAAAAAAAALAALASLAALLAAALLLASPPAPTPVPAPAVTRPHTFLNDTAAELAVHLLADELKAIERLRCCSRWTPSLEKAAPRTWPDVVLDYEGRLEPWWSKTSVLNWLYQSSLINPAQRWLGRVLEYAELLQRSLVRAGPLEDRYDGSEDAYLNRRVPSSNRHCLRQWLNLNKLTALMATVTDR